MYIELRTAALLVEKSLLQTMFRAALTRCVVKNYSHVCGLGNISTTKICKFN